MDVSLFQFSEGLITDDFSWISFKITLEKKFKIFYVDLLVNFLDYFLQHWLQKWIFVLGHVHLLVLHCDKLVVEIFVPFLEVEKFEGTTEEKRINFALKGYVKIPLNAVQIGSHQ